MANSMDTILVKYGAKEGNAPAGHSETKTIMLPEFLRIKPEELSDDERKIQEAVRLVYELNGKEPPLYKGFVNHTLNKPPLTISCIGEYYDPGCAVFNSSENEIGFIEKDDDLVASLAHELKHAEQFSQSEIVQIFNGNDNKAKRDLLFLDEAEAFFEGARAKVEIFQRADDSVMGIERYYLELSQKHIQSDGKPDIQKIKQEMMPSLVLSLYEYGPLAVYKYQSEMRWPIAENDVGLTHIPRHYDLNDDFLKTLNQIPREAQTAAGKIRQYFANNQEDKIIPLIKDIIRENPDSDVKGSILETFFNDFYMDKKEEKSVLKKLLSFEDADGTPFFGKKDLIELLRSSVRKGKRSFEADLKILPEKLPFTSKDCTEKSWFGTTQNKILSAFYTFGQKDQENLIQMLPEVLKLKGCDDNPLISEKQLAEQLANWSGEMEKTENVIRMFESIKDEKGNLPISREAFDIRNSGYNDGQNYLLSKLLYSSPEKEQYSLDILPVLMSLKDKGGKPVISQENIENFLKNSVEDSRLVSVVKMYADKPRTSWIKKLSDLSISQENSNPPKTSDLSIFVQKTIHKHQSDR